MTVMTSGMMSSLTDDWATPQYLFDELDSEFHFTLDVCASEKNRKVARYFNADTNGLDQDWGTEVCWMNPPYGRTIGQWVRKAVEAKRGGGCRGLPIARKDGYALVEGLRHASQRVEVHIGPCQVRQRIDGSAVPFGDSHLRHAHHADNQAGQLSGGIRMKPTDCTQCYHYGRIIPTGRVGCAIRGKCDVCPGRCHEFVRWKE